MEATDEWNGEPVVLDSKVLLSKGLRGLAERLAVGKLLATSAAITLAV